MDTEILYRQLKEVALTQFAAIVADAFVVRGPLYFPRCLRIIFIDDSFMEIRISDEKYSFHYDRRYIDGGIYRLDNAPHHKTIKTYPAHFHRGKEDSVVEDSFGEIIEEKFVNLLKFVEEVLRKRQ